MQTVKTLLGLEANLNHVNSSAEVAFNHAANDDPTEVTQILISPTKTSSDLSIS